MPDVHLVNDKNQLFAGFQHFFLDEKTSDVVFIVEDAKFPAHRLMLASQSEYFRTLLFNDAFKEAQKQEVELKETSQAALKVLLEYFYKGELNLDNYDMPTLLALLELSQRYTLETLKSKISTFLELKVSEENVTQVVNVAVVLNLECLEDKCWWILAMVVEGMFELDIVLDLDPELIKKLLSFCSDKVSAIKLFRAAILLLNKVSKVQRPELYGQVKSDIKDLVDFSKISVDELYEQVLKSNIFSAEEFICLTRQLNESGWLDKSLMIPDQNLYKESNGNELVMVLDLGRKVLINNLKFQHLGFTEKCLDIQVSVNSKNWIKVCTSIKTIFGNSTLNVHFSEIGARYIKITESSETATGEDYKLDKKLFEAYYVSEPPLQIAGFCCPFSFFPFRSYSFYIYHYLLRRDDGKCERVLRRDKINSLKKLNIKSVQRNTPFIAHKLSFQGRTRYCFGVHFDQPFILSSFRFRLWDFDGRKFSYKITLCTPQDLAEVIVSDKSDELVDGWQVVTFSPKPVSKIFIYCNNTTIGDEFRISYFEVPAQFDEQT